MSTLTPGFESSSPEINSRLFEGQNGHNFWIGRIATLDSVDGREVYDAASVLRANVYSSLGYISPESVDSLGREIDEDDARSVHFAIIERPDSSNGSGRLNVIGTSRLIIKDSPDKKLPIEHYFPEVFDLNPAVVGSAEGSRLIASHEDKRIQYRAGLALVRAMTHYSISNDLKADYGMAEEPLLRLFDKSGIPTRKLGESKDIPEYGGVLFPVEIETKKIVQAEIAPQAGKAALKAFFINGQKNLGEGFYSGSFIR